MRSEELLAFGKRLRDARIAAGYRKARHLASAINLPENTYSRYERGEAFPRPHLLEIICNAIRVTPAHLRGAEGELAVSERPSSSAAKRPQKKKGPEIEHLAAARLTTYSIPETLQFPQMLAESCGESRFAESPGSAEFLKCQLESWKLARHFASAIRRPPASRAAPKPDAPLLQEIVRIYTQLMSDPRAFISHLASIDLHAIPASLADELIAQVDVFLEAWHLKIIGR